jgi:outer membrane protein OmpA-like peptidoglycan-associated protein
MSNKFRNYIEEIRIEGHTDSISNYYYNMKLSQERTRSVLEYVLENKELENGNAKYWVRNLLTANGLSYSKPLTSNTTPEGRDLNRRVEFRVRTDAEKKMKEIAGK